MKDWSPAARKKGADGVPFDSKKYRQEFIKRCQMYLYVLLLEDRAETPVKGYTPLRDAALAACSSGEIEPPASAQEEEGGGEEGDAEGEAAGQSSGKKKQVGNGWWLVASEKAKERVAA